jgi:hypothetical protein
MDLRSLSKKNKKLAMGKHTLAYFATQSAKKKKA